MQRTTNFAKLLSASVTTYSDRPAIFTRDAITTYGQLGKRCASIALALKALGARPNDRIAMLASDPVDTAAGFFACLANGCTGIIINESYRARQVEFVLRHARVEYLLTTRSAVEGFARTLKSAAKPLFLEDVSGDGDKFDVAEMDSRAPAQIIYTSGSTGQPKGVVTSHAALWAGVEVVSAYLGLRSEDRIASLLPFSFVYGFNQLTTSLYMGATLVVDRSTLAAEIVDTLRRERVTVLAGVPPLWRQLLATRSFREQPLPHLRVLTCAGGKLSPSDVKQLRGAQPHAKLFLMYGLTEVFRSTYLPPDLVDEHPDSMGHAVPESTVYVVDEQCRPVDVGETGELVHGGPTVALGYLDDAATTAEVFRDNPFLDPGQSEPSRVVFSGDLVRRDENGLLYYVGRRDRMIKTLGYRVSPEEITDVILASNEVSDAAIVTEPDDVRGERIIACLVMRPSGDPTKVRQFCRMELPRHMQPIRFEILEAIPRNANGKHDFFALRRAITEGLTTTV